MRAFNPNLTLLWVTIYLTLASAGEVILYHHKKCRNKTSADAFIVFSSDKSTSCVNANQLPGNPVLSASTSHNIGRSCTFAFFHDQHCQNPAGHIVSSGPRKNCLPIPGAAHSFKVTCRDARPGNVLALPDHLPDTLNNGGFQYFQPHTTYRGKPSGHTWWFTYLPIIGAHKEARASGSARVVGEALTKAVYQNVPAQGHKFTTSVDNGGTHWTLHVEGRAASGYKVERVVREIGQASFASMVVGNVESLLKHPELYLFFSLGNSDNSAIMGSVNITYS